MDPRRTVREEFMSAFADQVTVRGAGQRMAASLAVQQCMCWLADAG